MKYNKYVENAVEDTVEDAVEDAVKVRVKVRVKVPQPWAEQKLFLGISVVMLFLMLDIY